jgi:hypothetical protein
MWAWCLHIPRVKFNTGEMEMIFLRILALCVLVALSTFTQADGDIIVVGASDASQQWPVVRDPTGKEMSPSRNALIDGQYRGLCSALEIVLGLQTNIRCPAVAGAMSTPFTFDWNGGRISWPGYAAQFTQGLREATWNGHQNARYLIVTLANDGPNAIVPTMQLIDRARGLGMRAIVEAYPAWSSFSARQQKAEAVIYHGDYFGSLLQAFLQELPTRAQYLELAQGHRLALEHYPGVIAYRNFYPTGTPKRTFDGVHVRPDLQVRAATMIKNLIEADQTK